MKIERQDLLNEIILTMKDEFVAEITENDDGFGLKFANGQVFQLSLTEK